MTDREFYLLLSMLWLVASQAARPELRKDETTWAWFSAAYIVCLALAISGVKAP